jgi:hypothetical protein
MELQSIINQTPPEIGPFDRWWVQSVQIVNRRLSASFVSYDGTHILSEYIQRIHIADETSEQGLTELLDSTLELVKTLASKTERPRALTVAAPHPSKPVRCTAIFGEAPQQPLSPHSNDIKELPFIVADLFEAASQDESMASCVAALFGFIALKASQL